MLRRLKRVRVMLNQILGPGQATPEVDVTAATRAWRAGSAQILDVREPEEWAAGHIPGAVHIPLGDLPQRTVELDATRPVITVCRSGRRSLAAADVLLAAGFADAASLAGGMIAWDEAHQPVEHEG